MPFCPACKTQYSQEERFCHLDGAALLPDEPSDPYIGKQIGNYRIESKLGEGGMGMVYKAVHPSLGRSAAIKFLRPEYTRDRDVLGRFFDEARAVNRIRHKNILDVFDLGQTPEGAAYLIAEFLEGEDLEHRLKRERRLSVPQIQHIFSQICDALSAAHQKGIVHRDLKPENIFLCSQDGQSDFVKLVDFGIAKLIQPDGSGPKRTQTGLVIGTPHYMSPEQGAGNRSIDHRSDLYSLGVILYECLAGMLPFRADTFAGVVMQHILEKPPPLRQAAPDADIPPALEAIVMRLLAKKPEERFQDASALGEALKRLELPDASAQEVISEAKKASRNAPTVVQKGGAPAPLRNAPTVVQPPATAPLATATLPAKPLPWKSTQTPPPKDEERKKSFRTLALISAPAILLLLLGFFWGKSALPLPEEAQIALKEGELFPKQDKNQEPPAEAPPAGGAPAGAPEAPRRPRECEELFTLVCSCEPLREPNCEGVPRQIDEIEEQLISVPLPPKEVEKKIKAACKDTLRRLRPLSARVGCREGD